MAGFASYDESGPGRPVPGVYQVGQVSDMGSGFGLFAVVVRGRPVRDGRFPAWVVHVDEVDGFLYRPGFAGYETETDVTFPAFLRECGSGRRVGSDPYHPPNRVFTVAGSVSRTYVFG